MEPEGWNKVKEIAAEAMEKRAPERAAFLDRACGGNAALRASVDALVRAHDRAGPFLAEPTAGAPRAESVEAEGAVIGRYKLLQKIGEGGFGVVYMVEQTAPVRRRVALKVIKAGMDTRQIVGRFEAERQALALMDHPHIAKVLDAGTTEAGRPYFVMELVKGVPVTEYCDQAQLDTAQRLDLFQKICHAVQHAHQKGVIHRDLKPSNVLVTLHDGVAVPKVIDFGVAKALDHRLTEKTVFTEFRQMIGTPDYMAPEQAEMSGLDVDTRADVYSLGVLLYELLTGTKPFDARELLSRGYEEMLRTIREVDPPKPSTRLSTMGEGLLLVARKRDTPPRLLGRIVRGDLDWIVMKAMEKDRARRYETANSLAMDVGRFLRDEPVLARAPSTAYRLRKYVRRHRAGVTAAVLILGALVAGAGAATVGLVRARAQEREARREAARASTIQGLLGEMLAASNPWERKGPNYTVRELLDDFDRRMTSDLATEPAVEATVRAMMARAFTSLGLDERAAPHAERALEVGLPALGPDHEVLADALRTKGRVRSARGDLAGAEQCLRAALAMQRRLHGPVHETVAVALIDLSAALERTHRYDEPEALHVEAIAILRQVHGGPHRDLAHTLASLSDVHARQLELDQALRLARESQAMYEGLFGKGHVEVADALLMVAEVHQARGEFADAERLAREALATLREGAGPDAPETIGAQRVLGNALAGASKFAAAEEQIAEALARCRVVYGDRHPTTARTLGNLGICRAARGAYDGALDALREAETTLRAILPGHNELAVVLGHLGQVHERRGDSDLALRCFEEALEITRKTWGEDHAETALVDGMIASLLVRLGKPDEAEPRLRRALAIQRSVVGVASPNVLALTNDLGHVLWRLGKRDEARAVLREALDIGRARLRGQRMHSQCAANLAQYVEGDECARLVEEALAVAGDLDAGFRRQLAMNLAVGFYGLSRWEEAARLFAEALPHLEGLPVGERTRLDYLHAAAATFLSLGRAADAEGPARESLELRRRLDVDVWRGCLFLGAALEGQEKHAAAEPLLREALPAIVAGSWLHAWATSLLGGALAGQGRFEEAKPLVVGGYEALAPPPDVDLHKRAALERVVKLYEAWGKPQEAEEWRARGSP